MYITYDEYSELYDPVETKTFNRISYDAFRVMDMHTTGIDNVKKLKVAFPDDFDNANAVKLCAAKLISFLVQLEDAEKSAAIGRGYEKAEDGVRRKIISHIQSGNESVSYADSRLSTTSIDAAAADKSVRDKMLFQIVRECLSGVTDANGVNLLYMGVYPRV